MILRNPQAAGISCADCLKWIVDIDSRAGTMELNDWPRGSGKYRPRPRGMGTPCNVCPKCKDSQEKSPRVGRLSDLSLKNVRTLALYYRAQACGGRLPGMDEVTRKNFGVIHRMLESNYRANLSAVSHLMALVGR